MTTQHLEGRILIPEDEKYPAEFKDEVVLEVSTGLRTIQFVNGEQKESPQEVAGQVNRLFELHGLDQKLAVVDCGDDNYYFILLDT